VPRDERPPGSSPTLTPSDGAMLTLLREGDLSIVGHLPRASNSTYLAKVRGGGEEALAVYKPRDGEAPLWDFPPGTLCRREVAAYVVARSLGWPRVPPTVLRGGPVGPGSVQLFVEFDPSEHYFTLAERIPDEFRTVALFDAVVNNADRKSGHCLLGTDGDVFVIDHGVCFHEAPKLRTVIWDFAGEDVPASMRADLRGLAAKLEEGPDREELGRLLSGRELEAMQGRLNRLIRAARFPEPGSERSYPWPPV
jgi:Phosphatidylinositol 3- and 4-kinase